MQGRFAGSTNDAYQKILRDLIHEPEYHCAPRGLGIREITNYCIEISRPGDDAIKTANVERNEKIARYTSAEFDLFNRGVNDVKEFAKHAKFWESIGNPDGTVNSSYGKIIWYDRTVGTCNACDGVGALYQAQEPVELCESCQGAKGAKTPWQWCKESLFKDKFTRQATLLFMRPNHLTMCKDVICTCHGQFLVRNNRLELTVVMRSNDVVKGTVYDIPWFCHVLIRMGAELGIQVGKYVHFAHSMHLYDTDLELARSMVHQ